MREVPTQPEALEAIDEILRVLRLCHPDFETTRTLTFSSGRKDPVADWNLWCSDIFLPIIAPALLSTIHLAQRGHVREIQQLCTSLDAALAPYIDERSRHAGARLLMDFTAPPGARVLQKLRNLHAREAVSAHFICIYGVRCALFNIPPALAILAVLYAEWQTGTRWAIAPRHMPDFHGLVDEIPETASETDAVPFFSRSQHA